MGFITGLKHEAELLKQVHPSKDAVSFAEMTFVYLSLLEAFASKSDGIVNIKDTDDIMQHILQEVVNGRSIDEVLAEKIGPLAFYNLV